MKSESGHTPEQSEDATESAAFFLLGVLKNVKRFSELACVCVDDDFIRGPSGKKPATKDVYQFPRWIMDDIDRAIAKATVSP